MKSAMVSYTAAHTVQVPTNRNLRRLTHKYCSREKREKRKKLTRPWLSLYGEVRTAASRRPIVAVIERRFLPRSVSKLMRPRERAKR